jgi:opacity protein-like surface antigen
MKKILFTTFLVLLFSVPLQAQDLVTLVDWGISYPMSDTKDYIGSRASWRGVSLDVRKYVGDGVASFGGRFGWHVMDSGAVTETISIRTDELNGDVSGTQFRYLNSFPMMGVVHVYFGDPSRVNAYVGAGVGMYYIKQRFEIGLLATEQNNWHFGIAPEFGVNVPVGDSISANFSIVYNYAAKTGSDVSGNEVGHQYLVFNIGLGFYNDIF